MSQSLTGRNWSTKKAKKQVVYYLDESEDEEEIPQRLPPLDPFEESLFEYKPGRIAIRIIYVVGKQRSGKSTMVKSLVAKAQQQYEGGVYFLISNDLSDLFKNFHPDRRRNVFFIDDAGTLQSSYEQRTAEAVEKFLLQKVVAHLAKKAGFNEGCITVFYGSQNDTLVGKQLRRDASVYMLKCLNLREKEDRELLRGLKRMNDEARAYIDRWILAVDAGEDWALSKALVILMDRSWGFYTFEKHDELCKVDAEFDRPRNKKGQVISDEQPVASEFLKGLAVGSPADMEPAFKEILSHMEKEEKWAKKIKCYEMSRSGMSQTQIAEDVLGTASKQSTMGEWIKSARQEAKRRLGAVYEEAITLRLTKAGWHADHDGTNGRPDIIAEKGGRILIVSCKCLEDPKKVVSQNFKEFAPEINEAKVRKMDKFVLFFYNLAWKGEIVQELDKDLTTATLRQSEALPPGDLKTL